TGWGSDRLRDPIATDGAGWYRLMRRKDRTQGLWGNTCGFRAPPVASLGRQPVAALVQGGSMSKTTTISLILLHLLVRTPSFAHAQTTLPDGNGKAAVQTHCIQCHELSRITTAGHTRLEWQNVV